MLARVNPLVFVLVLAALPDLPLPKGQSFNVDTASEVNFAELAVLDSDKTLKVRGHRWRVYVQASTSDAELWAQWKPLLLAKGWRSTGDKDGHSLQRKDGATDWRLLISARDNDAPLVMLLRVGGAPLKLELKPPAENAAPTKDDEDFPFAPNFPGQQRSGAGHSEVPFTVSNGTAEPRFIADAREMRWYQAPATLSRLEAVLSAADGLKRAGWQELVVNEEDGFVQAHYLKNGRDVWLQVSHAEDGTDQALTFGVVDVGAEDLGKRLDTECKLTLRGVTFEFNRATLKPESEVTLARVGKVLATRPALKLEVGGHTDARGADAYNQKLSEARAASVAAWFTSHGVAVGRLTSRGYGETQPVAENDSEQGRAKNRRVELGCVK